LKKDAEWRAGVIVRGGMLQTGDGLLKPPFHFVAAFDSSSAHPSNREMRNQQVAQGSFKRSETCSSCCAGYLPADE
jgi:hypothetical protein